MTGIWKIGMMAAALALAACDAKSPLEVPGGGQPGNGQPGTGQPPTQAPGNISLEGVSSPLLAGDTARLTVRVWSPDGQELTPPVVWSSANPSLATVTADGLLTAVAGGTVKIDVLVGGYPTYMTVQIRNRAAVLEDISPRKVMIGSESMTLTVRGQGFLPGAQVMWWKTALPTTRISDTELRAEIPAAELRRYGGIPVTVVNPLSQAPSSPLDFVIERAPLVETQYELVGLESGGGLPVETRRGPYKHWRTGVEYAEVIRTISQASLTLQARAFEELTFVQIYTETIVDAATGAVVDEGRHHWFGLVHTNVVDGSILFISGGLPGTVPGRRPSQSTLVMEQSLGGGERSWTYRKQ
jgi:hypothetical protein